MFKTALHSPEAEEYHRKYTSLAEEAETHLKQSGVKFETANLAVIVATLVRAQYAHAHAFTHASRVKARELTGHFPFSVQKIYARHPGMMLADPSIREDCLLKHEEMKTTFATQGLLTEINHDNFQIPETKAQKQLRAKGGSCKDTLNAPWRHRFTWDNHEKTVAIRRERAQAKALLEAEKAAKAAKKRNDVKNLNTYKLGKPTAPKYISAKLQEKYNFFQKSARHEQSDDYRCFKCEGYWSTWVCLDLDQSGRKWMQPDMLLQAEPTEPGWYCGLKSCKEAGLQKDKINKQCNEILKAEQEKEQEKKQNNTNKTKKRNNNKKSVKKSTGKKRKALIRR